MIRRALVSLALAGLASCCSVSALADNIHLCDITSTTSCNAGSVIPIHGNLPQQTWVFGTAAPIGQTETLWIAVLTPQSTGSGTFNGPVATSSNLWAALGVGPTQNFPNFSSTASQEFGATGITAASFGATSFEVGAWTGSVNVGQPIMLPNEPVGTIFMAYVLSNGNLIEVSPWSSSMVFVPEPSNIMLLGVGLLALGALAGRRFLAN